jgi:hypothetical protein
VLWQLGRVRNNFGDGFTFSLIYSFKGVNLSELQKTLDTQGIELVENQKESVVGRKALADKTKGSRPEVVSTLL